MPLSPIVQVHKDCYPLLLALLEGSNVEISIGILESPLSFFLAIYKLPIELPTVLPLHLSISLNSSILKLTIISLIVLFKVVGTYSLEHPIYEIPLVIGTIRPHKLTLAVLLTHHKISFIRFCSIVPRFFSMTVLLVILPLSFVATAIYILIDAHPVTFVIFKFSNEIFTICIYLSSLSVSLVVFKLTFILTAIRLEHYTYSIHLVCLFVPKTLKINSYHSPLYCFPSSTSIRLL